MYRLYFNIKKVLTTVFAPAKNKILYPLLHKSTVHLVIIFIGLAVIANNIYAKEIPAEQIGQKSILTALTSEADQATITDTISTTAAKTNPNAQQAGLLAADANAEPAVTSEDDTSEIVTSETSGAVMNPGLTGTAIGERPRDNIIEYAVEGGDTISGIAAKFGISADTVLWANNIGPRDYIKPGQKLRILPQTGVAHEVKKGDTLEQIAKKYSADANAIMTTNKLADASAIEPGDVLIVPNGTMPETAQPKTTASTSKSQIVSVFNAPAPSRVTSSARLLWPGISHRINQYYRGGRHTGIDIDGDVGNPIYAADDGRIEYAAADRSGYGLHIIINHGGGIKTLYGHASRIYVHAGDSVKRGQAIGAIGCTGRCTGPHIHFEVRVNGRFVNPLTYL